MDPLIGQQSPEALFDAVLALLKAKLRTNSNRPQNLVRWQTVDSLTKVPKERRAEAGDAVTALLSGSGESWERSGRFSEAWIAIYGSVAAKGWRSGARDLGTLLLLLKDPTTCVFVRETVFEKIAAFLGGTSLFVKNQTPADEYRHCLQFCESLAAALGSEPRWKPKDLVDVQGFMWVIKEFDAVKSGPGTGDTVSTISSPAHKPPSPKNLILYGPPGTGKTYTSSARAVELCDGVLPPTRAEVMARYRLLVEEERITFVTFHQSYAYEDFVEGLRPETDRDGSVGFSLSSRDGIFKQIAERARKSFEQAVEGEPLPYVLVIDEINRGNISKVFGELITLLEPDKRLGAENELKVSLPYSGDHFGVPPNLHIVGTMNTADRSIALLDTALRRRFDFEELMPNPAVLKTSTATALDLAAFLTTLNDRIEYLFDREHQIGHAFFISCQTVEDVDAVMRQKVLPLLVEYFYDDWEKIRLVLGETSDDGVFVRRQKLEPPKTMEAYPNSEVRWRYAIKENFDGAAYQNVAP